MAKTINWDENFEHEVLSEDCDGTKVAFRLGRLYYDNEYYQKGDVVDIRVNQIFVRAAEVIDTLKIFKINELNSDIFKMSKSSIKNQKDLVNYLRHKHNKNIDDNELVTVVKYKNKPIDEYQKDEVQVVR